MVNKIIEYISINRVSTTEVADAMDKTGAIKGVKPVNKGHFCVGPIHWVYAWHGSNWDVHEQIRRVKKGEVVFIDCFGCDDKAIFGHLVSKFLILYKQASAIIVNGLVRDAQSIIKDNFPIWCHGFTPIGCTNTKSNKELDKNLLYERKNIFNSSIAVCDDTGVVVIPHYMLNDDLYKKLIFIEQQEDIWYDCIDRIKMSTFDTICLKKYQNN